MANNEIEKWGFDFTHISASDWKVLMQQLNLTDAGLQTKEPLFEDVPGVQYWSWENPNIHIRTGNHPITGIYAGNLPREPETGYASYIGIEGKPEFVKHATDFIRKHGRIRYADIGMGESPHKCDFI